MHWRKRIAVNPDVLAGKPHVRGTRLSAGLILERLGDGWSIPDLCRSYPHLTADDLQAVFTFAAEFVKCAGHAGRDRGDA